MYLCVCLIYCKGKRISTTKSKWVETAGRIAVEDVLKSLCAWLHEVTDKDVVILLDEYDVPLQNAALKGMKTGDFELYDKVV